MILDVFLNGGDWSPKFSSRFLRVSITVGKVALHQVSSLFDFTLLIIISPLLHPHLVEKT
jgi:hypothetical protein